MPSTTVRHDPADRIRLPMTFDVDKMQRDISNMGLRDFIYYDVLPLRAPAYTVDPTAAPPRVDVVDFADGTWTDWLDTSTLASSAYLNEVVETFKQHTRVTLVRLLRLEAGAVVDEHTDPTLGLEQERSLVRLTIPIQVSDDVTFFLNDEPVPMQMGECWYLRLTDPHRVVNAGSSERVNLTVDVEPNDWVRSLLG